MIRVCFAGVTGWTAPPIVAAIDAADDLTLTCGVSRSAAGQTLPDATASRSDGSVYASVSEALQSAEVDVLVDYTSAAAVKENVRPVRAGVHGHRLEWAHRRRLRRARPACPRPGCGCGRRATSRSWLRS